ncbi:hypothetical protein HDV00_003622 [Rhizophlyctis rosea]|nr:hypothetical protein HDV00_003622 [Rhizophlyctis rosea]
MGFEKYSYYAAKPRYFFKGRRFRRVSFPNVVYLRRGILAVLTYAAIIWLLLRRYRCPLKTWAYLTGTEPQNLITGALRSPIYSEETNEVCRASTWRAILDGPRKDWEVCVDAFERNKVPKTLYQHGLAHTPTGTPLNPRRPFLQGELHPPVAPSPQDRPPHLTGHCHSSTYCPVIWVFYATFCNEYSNRLITQVNEAGFPLAVLEHGEAWRGYSARIRAYHNYLLTLPPDSIAIITDTYDVLLQPTCSQSDIISAFKRQGSPIVFSSEVYCWPDKGLWSSYPEAPPKPNTPLQKSDYRYLNAGTMIGYVKDLLPFLAESYTSDCEDDQRGYTRTFLSRLQQGNEHTSVSLDYYQDIFLTIQGTDFGDLEFREDRMRGRRVRNLRTGGEGCVVHQNGDKSNGLLERIAGEVGVLAFGEGYGYRPAV